MAKKKISAKEAKELISNFMFKAKQTFSKNKELANKFVQKARRLAMKTRSRMPSEIKRNFCKHCHSFLIPGQNLRVRTQKGKLVYYCLECKKHWRMPYHPLRLVPNKGQK